METKKNCDINFKWMPNRYEIYEYFFLDFR